MRRKHLILTLILGLTLVFIAGCSLFRDPNDILDVPPEEAIEDGMSELRAERYTNAAEIFQRLRDQHPYSRYAILAELKMADALFLAGQYDAAVEAYQEFETLHPKNEAIPYVIYQMGVCYLNTVSSIDREQSGTKNAIQTFNLLIGTFPESEYRGKAEAKLVEAQNFLAGHEFYIAEFYYKQGKYKSALGRFIGLIQKYPDTGYHGQALDYIRDCRLKISEIENKEKLKAEKKQKRLEKKQKRLEKKQEKK